MIYDRREEEYRIRLLDLTVVHFTIILPRFCHDIFGYEYALPLFRDFRSRLGLAQLWGNHISIPLQHDLPCSKFTVSEISLDRPWKSIEFSVRQLIRTFSENDSTISLFFFKSLNRWIWIIELILLISRVILFLRNVTNVRNSYLIVLIKSF